MTDFIEKIWKKYNRKLHLYINKRVNHSQLSDDILQEVFIKVQARIETLKSEQKVQSWLYQITRNKIADHFRTQKTTEWELTDNISPQEPIANEKARLEISNCLLPMIKNLPHHYRDAIMLSEIAGLKQKEVAVKQNISLSGVKSRIQRGRALLRNKVLDCCLIEQDSNGRVFDYEEKK